MPEPRISSQPPCLQSRQPSPRQTKHSTSTSAEGSVNGKKDGRKRMRERGPNISRANSSSVPLRSAMVMPRSTASPSTWWNIGECDMSAAARQREVEPPAAPLGLSLRLVGRGEPRVQQAFELALGLVRSRADERALIRGQRAERSQELRQGALAAEHADADRFELGGRLRRGDRLSSLLDDGVDARVPHELPALGSSGLGELRERGRIGHRQLRQHLAIEVDPRLLERGHEFRVREPHLAARRVDPHDPEAPRLALLLLAAAVRERPSPQDGLGGGLVELPAATEIPLRLLEDLLAPSARLRSTLCPWHSPTPPGSQIGHEHPQPGLVRFVDQFRRTESPATLGILLLEL